MQGAKQGSGRQASDHSHLVFELGVFFLTGKNKEAGVTHILGHCLIIVLGVKVSLVCDSLTRFMAGGPLAHLALEKQSEFVR